MLTRHDLNGMGSCLSAFYEQSDPLETDFIRRVHSLDELWSQLQTKQIRSQPVVPTPVDGGFLMDAWHRPYQLDIRTADRGTVIRITSSGADGIFDNGQGDDLYVEITFAGKKAIVTMKE